jgi:hypothetical protein
VLVGQPNHQQFSSTTSTARVVARMVAVARAGIAVPPFVNCCGGGVGRASGAAVAVQTVSLGKHQVARVISFSKASSVPGAPLLTGQPTKPERWGRSRR